MNLVILYAPANLWLNLYFEPVYVSDMKFFQVSLRNTSAKWTSRMCWSVLNQQWLLIRMALFTRGLPHYRVMFCEFLLLFFIFLSCQHYAWSSSWSSWAFFTKKKEAQDYFRYCLTLDYFLMLAQNPFGIWCAVRLRYRCKIALCDIFLCHFCDRLSISTRPLPLMFQPRMRLSASAASLPGGPVPHELCACADQPEHGQEWDATLDDPVGNGCAETGGILSTYHAVFIDFLVFNGTGYCRKFFNIPEIHHSMLWIDFNVCNVRFRRFFFCVCARSDEPHFQVFFWQPVHL